MQVPLKLTHQSHFTVHQSSKFPQPGALIFILGVAVQLSQVCSRSYQLLVVIFIVPCVSVRVDLSAEMEVCEECFLFISKFMLNRISLKLLES